MGRPEIPRRVGCGRAGRAFKPAGRPARDLAVRNLQLDELEALRLADLEGLYQETAAERMGVSRATFARILGRARAVVADVLVNEHLLMVGEGTVITGPDEPLPCPLHEGGRRRGRGCRCHDGSRRRGRQIETP